MTAIELYKFVKNNQIEYHYTKDHSDVLIFIPLYNIEEWDELLGPGITAEDPIKCYMKYGYLCFYMQDICNYFDIYLAEVFGEEEEF